MVAHLAHRNAHGPELVPPEPWRAAIAPQLWSSNLTEFRDPARKQICTSISNSSLLNTAVFCISKLML